MAANVGGGNRSAGGAGVGGAAGTGTVAACRASGSRWTPTPEQIRILKELYYGCGIRSPNAEQIQRITAMLRQHGKIEGKNVFYWFQNHKARERQKRRLTTLDVNAAPAADDATSHHLGVLSLSSPSAGTDYMGLRSTGSAAAASPWACFSSPDPRAATRAPETLPLFPTRDDSHHQSQPPPRPRHGAPAREAVRSGSYLPTTLPFWGAAAAATTTASSTASSVAIQQQHHQLLQLQEQYSFYSQLPGGQDQDASSSLELSLSSWCSAPYPAGTM
ncbi:hypothetical protein U9M48_034179 [Paspalum notatum var. saurae]|uniref:Homeobox domain-containing protein n=1 Tax=Paspalum notatum var. saurae TaxID=547442 RepID=A0AAQ3UC72_PASNO